MGPKISGTAPVDVNHCECTISCLYCFVIFFVFFVRCLSTKKCPQRAEKLLFVDAFLSERLLGCFFFSKIMIAFLHFCVSEIFFHCSNYLLLMHRFAHVNVVRVKWDQTRKPAITTQTVTRKSNQSELGTLKKKKKFLSLSVDDEQVLSHRLRVHFNSTFQHKGKPSPNAPRLSFGLSAAR